MNKVMKNSKAVKIYLVISGLLLTFVGGATLLMPVELKASAGMELAGDINALNDVRGFSALLLGFAMLALFGAFAKHLTYTSTLTSTLLFLTLAIGRVISFIVDGIPVEGLVKATVLEVIFGLAGAILFGIYRNKH